MLYKLESLRGLAAILVVLHHIDWGPSSSWFVKNSLLFVDFFFVLSGFVIALAYTKKIEDGMSFFHYFGLRLARLYPLHMFIMLLWLPYIGAKYYLYNAGFGGVDPSISENTNSFIVVLLLLNAVGYLDYLSWNVPSWSIGTEIIAYIFFFFSFLLAKKIKLPLKWFYLFVSISCYAIIFYLKGPNIAQITEWAFLRCIAAFCLGVFLYYSLVNVQKSLSFAGIHEYISFFAMLLAVTLVSVNQYFAYVAVVLFAYVILVFAQETNGLLGSILEHNWAKSLGKWSYSIYMIHMLFVSSFADAFEHVLKLHEKNVSFAGYCAINVLVLSIVIFSAYLTYRFIEVPSRDYFRSRLNGSLGKSTKH